MFITVEDTNQKSIMIAIDTICFIAEQDNSCVCVVLKDGQKIHANEKFFKIHRDIETEINKRGGRYEK